MLRGFLLIFVLAAVAIIAMAGFRGEHSPRTPWELMPDMVRQMKVRAQAPLGFFGDGRGPRVPVANTVPMGYEMPKRRRSRQAARLQVRNCHTSASASASAPIITIPARWE